MNTPDSSEAFSSVCLIEYVSPRFFLMKSSDPLFTTSKTFSRTTASGWASWMIATSLEAGATPRIVHPFALSQKRGALARPRGGEHQRSRRLDRRVAAALHQRADVSVDRRSRNEVASHGPLQQLRGISIDLAVEQRRGDALERKRVAADATEEVEREELDGRATLGGGKFHRRRHRWRCRRSRRCRRRQAHKRPRRAILGIWTRPPHAWKGWRCAPRCPSLRHFADDAPVALLTDQTRPGSPTSETPSQLDQASQMAGRFGPPPYNKTPTTESPCPSGTGEKRPPRRG